MTDDVALPADAVFAPLPPIKLVSLVVVAYNEQDCLPDLLADIATQDFPHNMIELLLVNSASSDCTQQLMQGFAAGQHDFQRVLLLQNPAGFLPHGCNVALAAYAGDVFLRIDAHARIPADFVRRNVQVLQAGHWACGGLRPVALRKPNPWGEVLLAAESSAFGSSPAAYRRNPQTAGVDVKSVFHGAYRRQVLEAVGRYDERLLRTEDNDMSLRIRQAGYRIHMDPGIRSQQYLRSSLLALLSQKAANGFWIGRTLLVQPKAVSLAHLVPAAFSVCLLATILLGIFLSWLPLIALAACYLACAIAISVKAAADSPQRNARFAALPLVVLAMHICYGAGTLAGLFRGLFGRQRRH
ncbi:MAG: glycosyltransferase [Actinomycetia bacterium]|nr:glycosyltransferase [Actinomycetes bacterium]